jgi:hypothetical protein
VKRKTLLVLAGATAVVLAVGFAVLMAPMAQSTTVATSPNQRIAKLEAQMKVVQADLKASKVTIGKLNASVIKLSASLDTVNGAVNTEASAIKCLTFGQVPIAQYGGATPTPHGYVYTNDGGATFGLSTALDVVPAGAAPAAFVAAVDPACIKPASVAGASSAAGRIAQPMFLRHFRLAH